MNKNIEIGMCLQIFSKCAIAYIENLLDNKGIHLVCRKPTIQCYQGELNLIAPECDPSEYLYGLEFIQIKEEITLECKDIVLEMKELGIEEFVKKYFFEKGEKIAKIMEDSINRYKFSDLCFSSLPEFVPYLSVTTCDSETGFKLRSVLGATLCTNESILMVDINYLILERVREVIELNEVGKEIIKWVPVSQMTEDQRKIWDKHPKID